MPKISVIIPVYNSEKYLSETLDSVLNQTFKDFEVICIDDGSSDSSVDILKKYAQKDERIKVISQKNLGVVTARNNAIQQSSGEYIYTLDSDDIIDKTTLEKMYNAMVGGCGDVITCRVKKFGFDGGEMSLQKPNKFNMAMDNCLVNAALFRRSDFEKSGGFDKNYNVGLEDYDLWLNFVFKMNKKIYRIPEILFFYRIKDKTESRNLQNLANQQQHSDLMQSLYKKYPKMKFYKNLNTFKFVLRKIHRFFFRIQNNRIKIFKIPVCRFCKYDSVMSVGAACFVPEALKNAKLRNFSGPFDWMFGSDVVTRLKIIENGFIDYFNFEDFEFVGENPDNGKMIYKNLRTKIIYNHDFLKGDFKDVFPEIKEKYNRRIQRVLEHFNNDKKILLVFAELNQSGDKKDIIEVMKKINKKYSAKIDLLYVNHNPNIVLEKYTNPKRISDTVIYAEYHYAKFPDETNQARHICKKLVKRIAL